MFKKIITIRFLVIVAVVSAILIAGLNITSFVKPASRTAEVSLRRVDSRILAEGKVASQNEANLHFQTGGKLSYLSVKEGDTVYAGQTIANLDTYALQRQLTAALNTYRSTRDTFDQTQDNSQNGVLHGQQRYSLEVPNKAGITGGPEENIINDMIKRIVDQNQATLDNSVINVELANYALQLSSLTSPFDGIVVHEDVNVAGQNVTPAASFLIIDPKALVFRANLNEQDIDYVDVGSPATVVINGDNKTYAGTVLKVYPEKISLPSGQNVYRVDIAVSDFGNIYYAQAGSVQIKSNVNMETLLVPTWLILNSQSIWVKEKDKTILKKVTVGRTHGDYTEILGGLSTTDQVVTNPESIVAQKYNIL
ncbi:MAG: efflux RND transporter periplasmic adaptor subunit [Candidatus Levyibacteriota bacterium]